MQEFNIDYIRQEWEYIIRRIKTVHNGAKVAALLGGCAPVDLDKSYTPPLLLIRTSTKFSYQHLLPFVEEDVVSWAIEMTAGIVCQVQLLPPSEVMSGLHISPDAELRTRTPLVITPPVSQASALLTQTVVETHPVRRQHWFEPLKLEYIQADWLQIKQMIYEKYAGNEISVALIASQPVALLMNEYPPTLVLRALNEQARTTLANHATDGSLMMALLNELGHVCRLQIISPGNPST